MPRPYAPWLLAVVTALGSSGCDKKSAKSHAAGACSRDRRCPSPQICVLRSGISAGRCVPPCAGDSDCPKGERCAGRYQPDGGRPAQRYCKRATVPPGGDCSGLRDGCQVGYQCRRGRTCVRSCRGNDDCSDEERCVSVPEQRVFGGASTAAYRVCARATLRTGAACAPDRRPLCARGYFCRRHKCVQECVDDAACGTGHRCDGVFQAGTAVGGALPAPRRYCRRAAAGGERCGRNPTRDVGCVEDHTCYRGKCRRLCETNADCPDTGARRQRCRRRRRRGTVFHICM